MGISVINNLVYRTFRKLGWTLTTIFIATACSNESQNLESLRLAQCKKNVIPNEFVVVDAENTVSTIKANSTDDFLLSLKDKEYKYIGHNFKISRPKSDDPFGLTKPNIILQKNWYLEFTKVDDMHKQGFFGKGVTIGIVDSGVNPENKLLSSKVNFDDSYDFAQDSPKLKPISDHGSNMQLLISSNSDQTGTNYSMAPQAEIIHASFLEVNPEDPNDIFGTSVTAAKAIKHLMDKNVDIINLSWGGDGCSQVIKSLILEATENGILVVSSSGNEGKDLTDSFNFPSSFSLNGLYNVGSIEPNSKISFFSNFGPSVKLYAPGSFLPAINENNAVKPFLKNGTSNAAAIISGALAILIEYFNSAPNFTTGDFYNITTIPFQNEGSQLPIFSFSPYLEN